MREMPVSFDATGDEASTEIEGVKIRLLSPDSVALALLERKSGSGDEGLVFHLVPASLIPALRSNPVFVEALRTGISVADGWWMAKVIDPNNTSARQLRGQNLLVSTCHFGIENNTRHYFLGASNTLLEALRARLLQSWPTIRIAGMSVFPHGSVSADYEAWLINDIRSSGAELVWLGISSPRQNIEAMWIARKSGARVACVGAALGFFSGEVSAAPTWMQSIGLEWLYRFISEPRRMWKRYLTALPQIAIEVLKSQIRSFYRGS